jgi:hypothetical protein
VVVHHGVPEIAGVGPRGERRPARADDDEARERQRRQPGAHRTQPARHRERHRERGQRAHEAQRILGEDGQPQRHAAQRGRDAGAAARAHQEPRQTPLDAGEKQRLGAHVAREGIEEAAGEQRDAGEEPDARAEQPRPQPGRGRHREHGARHRRQPRRPLGDAPDLEGARLEQIEERRLVEVADAVEPQGEPAPRSPRLARDLGMLALARVIERRRAEAGQEQRQRQRGGGEGHARGGVRAGRLHAAR